METEKPSAPTPNTPIQKKDIQFTNEYKLDINKINYLIKIGIVMEAKELAIFVQEDSIKEYYYQNCFSLEYFQNNNKMFKMFDKIEEIIDALKDIILNKKITITKEKEDEELSFILKFKILGKAEEEIKLILAKCNEKTEKIIENLKIKIEDLKSEVLKLKNEINTKKITKYKPNLENGWFVDPYTPQEFIVYKNRDGQVSFQGLLNGDWSKKIFTLEKNYRPKYRLTFPVIAAQAFHRIDILPNGEVYLSLHASLGMQGIGWVNLSGINYYIDE